VTDALPTMHACWLLVFAAGCSAGSDLGKPCIIDVPAADGGRAPLLQGEVTVGKDYLAVGVPACASGLCVRNAATALASDAGAIAYGYCTHTCVTAAAPCEGNATCTTFFDPFLGSPNICMQ